MSSCLGSGLGLGVGSGYALLEHGVQLVLDDLPDISPISPLYLPYTSPIPPLYLPYISPIPHLEHGVQLVLDERPQRRNPRARAPPRTRCTLNAHATAQDWGTCLLYST